MTLHAHADLHDAPAKDDDADGLNAGKDKIGQIIDNGEGIVCGQRRNGAKGKAKDQRREKSAAFFWDSFPFS